MAIPLCALATGVNVALYAEYGWASNLAAAVVCGFITLALIVSER